MLVIPSYIKAALVNISTFAMDQRTMCNVKGVITQLCSSWFWFSSRKHTVR